MREKVINPESEESMPQKPIDDLQLVELLPDKVVQENLVWQWAVLVSRVITKYLTKFKMYAKYVLYHIPHPYSKEMAEKSEIVSIICSMYLLESHCVKLALSAAKQANICLACITLLSYSVSVVSSRLDKY